MFSGPGFDLLGGKSGNPPSPHPLCHTHLLQLCYSIFSLHFPLCLFPPFLIPEQLLQSPALCLFFILFINLPVFCPPFFSSFTSLTVPFVDYQTPSLSHAFTFNSGHPAPCFTASLKCELFPEVSRDFFFTRFRRVLLGRRAIPPPGGSDGWRFRRR